MKKKKTEKVGTIKGLNILKNTRPIQDIPFRTGVYSDKRKKREKLIKISWRNGYKLCCTFSARS